MKREDVLAILKTHRENLRNNYGVKSLALFGSVARNEAGPGSDVDLLVEFEGPTGYFGLFQLQDFLSELLGCSVDVGTAASIKSPIRAKIIEDCIHVN